MITFDQLEYAKNVAISAALEAGNLLRSEFHRIDGPRSENSRSAIIDRIAESIIQEKLSFHFPQWEYQGEELKQEVHAIGIPYWTVDPNDGTAEFLKGQRGFSVSIALIDEYGEPVLGVVYSPCAPDDDGDLIVYYRGGKVTRNHQTIRRVPISTNRENHILIASLGADKKPSCNLELIQPSRFRCLPSIAYRLALVAVNEADIAISINSPNTWDIAAGHAILLGVGYEITNEYCQKIRYTPQGTLSSRGKFLLGGNPSLIFNYAKKEWQKIPLAKSEASNDPIYPVRTLVGSSCSNSKVLTRAQGCFLGAIIADSIELENHLRALGSIINEKFSTNFQEQIPLAGQGSTATELAILLSRALIKENSINLKIIAQYIQWWLTTYTNTLFQALQSANLKTNISPQFNTFNLQDSTSLFSVLHNIAQIKWIYPMAMFGLLNQHQTNDFNIPIEKIIASYPINACLLSLYKAILHTLRTVILTGDRERAFSVALQHILLTKDEPLIQLVRNAQKRIFLQSADMDETLVSFQNALYHLLHTTSFEDFLNHRSDMLQKSSSSAILSGAIVGAIVGYRNIPKFWSKMILSAHPTKNFSHIQIPRPSVLWSVDALQIAERLLTIKQNNLTKGKHFTY
ncbi:MAG: hypothetical protein N2450_02940 [bacterium]|nr:hypothetical protein [bacterium]